MAKDINRIKVMLVEKSDKFVACPAIGCKSANGLEMVHKFFSADVTIVLRN